MRSALAVHLVAFSLFLSGGVFAESVDPQQQQVTSQTQKDTEERNSSCLLAGDRCPACCTDNCKDCSACKPKALESQS